MKFSIDLEIFAKTLATLKPIVSRKATLPILGCVLIETTDTGIRITGTDLDARLALDIACEVEKPGRIAVAHSFLTAASAKMSGATVEIFADKKRQLRGKNAGMEWELNGLDPEEFPPPPKPASTTPTRLDGIQVAEAIRRSAASVSDDETRYVLNGMFFSVEDGRLEIVSTDGRRLSLTHLAEKAEGISCIVPAGAAAMLAALCDGRGFEFAAGKNTVEAWAPGWRLVSKQIEGTYPDWRRVIPEDGAAHRFIVDTGIFREALLFCKTLTDAKSDAITIALTAGEMRLSASTASVGSAAAVIAADVTGEGLTCSFNVNYLIEAASTLTAGRVLTGEIADAISALRLTDGTTQTVLMPMRVN